MQKGRTYLRAVQQRRVILPFVAEQTRSISLASTSSHLSNLTSRSLLSTSVIVQGCTTNSSWRNAHTRAVTAAVGAEILVNRTRRRWKEKKDAMQEKFKRLRLRTRRGVALTKVRTLLEQRTTEEPKSIFASFKNVLAKYGKVGFVVHTTVGMASLTSLWLSIKYGVDVRHVFSTVGVDVSGFADSTAFLLALACNKALFVVRAPLTAVITPPIAKQFPGFTQFIQSIPVTPQEVRDAIQRRENDAKEKEEPK